MTRRDTAATQFPLTIYYDASCRMCNAEMRHLMLRNQAGKLIFIDASTADLSQAPADKAALMQAIHGVGADGQVYVGVDCLTRAYLGVGWAWVPRLAGCRWWQARWTSSTPCSPATATACRWPPWPGCWSKVCKYGAAPGPAGGSAQRVLRTRQ